MKKLMLMLISIGIMSCVSTKQLETVDDGSNMVKVSLSAKPMDIGGKRIKENIHHGEYVELISFKNDNVSMIVDGDDTCYFYTEYLIIPTYIFDRTIKEVVCDCEYVEYGVDKFTKLNKIKTVGKVLSLDILDNKNMYIQCSEYGDIKYLILTFTSDDISKVEYVDKFRILFDNGEKLILYDTECIVSSFVVQSGYGIRNIFWSGVIYYPLSISDEKILLNNKVETARLYTKNSYVEMKVKRKNSNSISEELKCINNP